MDIQREAENTVWLAELGGLSEGLLGRCRYVIDGRNSALYADFEFLMGIFMDCARESVDHPSPERVMRYTALLASVVAMGRAIESVYTKP